MDQHHRFVKTAPTCLSTLPICRYSLTKFENISRFQPEISRFCTWSHICQLQMPISSGDSRFLSMYPQIHLCRQEFQPRNSFSDAVNFINLGLGFLFYNKQNTVRLSFRPRNNFSRKLSMSYFDYHCLQRCIGTAGENFWSKIDEIWSN